MSIFSKIRFPQLPDSPSPLMQTERDEFSVDPTYYQPVIDVFPRTVIPPAPEVYSQPIGIVPEVIDIPVLPPPDVPIPADPPVIPGFEYTPLPDPITLPQLFPDVDLPETPGGTDIALVSVIQISTPELNKVYIKDTMAPVSTDVFTVANTSEKVEVDIELVGTQGVSFDPTTFTLSALGTRTVNITYDVSRLNELPEGLSTINCMVNLSSKTVLDPPKPPPPPPPPPPPEIQTGVFVEEKFKGAPGVDGDTEQKVFAKTPVRRTTVTKIAASTGDPYTYRWTGKIRLDDGVYTFRVRVNDGVRVYLNGGIIMNYWHNSDTETHTKVMGVTGGIHDLRVEYFNSRRNGLLEFNYTKTASSPPTGGGGGIIPGSIDISGKTGSKGGTPMFSKSILERIPGLKQFLSI